MKTTWKKRALSYLVLVGVAVGAIWFMQKSPAELEAVVDLTGVRVQGGASLAELRVSYSLEGEWVCSTFYAFPEFKYPSGPPGNTEPVAVKLMPGMYDLVLEMKYFDASGEAAGAAEKRKMSLDVGGSGRLEIRAAQAVP
jgi:hypothetical protein